MKRDTFIIYMVFVFSQGIGGGRSVEAQNSQKNNECSMVNDLNGNCINITRCPTFHYPLKYDMKNSSIVNYLRSFEFEKEDNFTYHPKVCCPLENEPTTYTENSQRTTTPNNDSTISENYKLDQLIKWKACGRIIPTSSGYKGGTISNLAWSWMTRLGYLNPSMPNSKYEWKCGGSLISDRYVLTVAHCTVRLGVYCLAVVRLGDFNSETINTRTMDVAISRVIRHKEYNAQKFTNDIALLKLSNSVRFNFFIHPICLPILSHHSTNTFVESDLFVTGWGSTRFGGPQSSSLMEGRVRVMDNSRCIGAYAKKKFVIDDGMLCAGSLTGEQDACQGDSGGPLMWLNGNQFYEVGIVSFGYKCGEPDYPGVYTRVTSFIKWIEDNMN